MASASALSGVFTNVAASVGAKKANVVAKKVRHEGVPMDVLERTRLATSCERWRAAAVPQLRTFDTRVAASEGCGAFAPSITGPVL